MHWRYLWHEGVYLCLKLRSACIDVLLVLNIHFLHELLNTLKFVNVSFLLYLDSFQSACKWNILPLKIWNLLHYRSELFLNPPDVVVQPLLDLQHLFMYNMDLLQLLFERVMGVVNSLHVFPGILQLVILITISDHVLFHDADNWGNLVVDNFTHFELII